MGRPLAIAVVVFGLGAACGKFGDAPTPPDATAASCTDGVQSGDETDIDCGGSCSACEIGRSCVEGADCATRACEVGVCLSPRSCKLLADAGETVSGVYELQAGGATFDAYCDMETDGGGWTLVMKASSESNLLAYDSLLWTSGETLEDSELAPNLVPQGTDAVFQTYGLVVGTELRLQFLDPVHAFSLGDLSEASALSMLSGPELALVETLDCAPEAFAVVPGYDAAIMRHGAGHQFFGINGTDRDNGEDQALRFGFGSNNEDNRPWHPRFAIGGTDNSLLWEGQDGCGDCGCYGTLYDPPVTSANLWIR